jgi:hypothetical protein
MLEESGSSIGGLAYDWAILELARVVSDLIPALVVGEY